MPESAGKAFLELINQNLGIAHKICRAYFADKDDREDAVQEMMYQLWRSYKTFDGRSKFSTWMYRVCLNTALTCRRNTDRRKLDPLSDSHDNLADTASDDKEAVIGELHVAIRSLSLVNKAIVLLYLDGLSYDEISAITGLTRSNVGVRLVRIKKELNVLLKETVLNQ